MRTTEEIKELGIIKDAQQLDFYHPDFEKNILALDKTQKYIVYCKSGGRSAHACSFMESTGFKEVSNLVGGYTAWENLK